MFTPGCNVSFLQAGLRVSGLELGGLCGSLIAGRISDWLISRDQGKGGNVGKRVQVRALVNLPDVAQVSPRKT